MRRMAIAAAVVTVAAVAVLVWAPGIFAAQDTRIRIAEPQVQIFRSGGSSIGVTVRDVNADDVAKAKLDGARGVVIESVREDTPASAAGFRSGDVVIEFDGERVRSVQQFARLVQETASGRNISAVVMRDGSRQTLSVTPERASVEFDRQIRVLSDRAREQAQQLRDRALERRNFSFDFDIAPDIRTLVTPRQLGATLTTLSEQLESYFGVGNGVLVSSVQADSPASQAGLRAGDVITQVNGRRVEGPNDVTRAVRTAESGAEIELTVMREKKELMLKAKIPARRSGSGSLGVAL